MKNKLLATLVVLALMASSLMVTTVVAERNVDDSDPVGWILSNDGYGSLANNLTCGKEITLQIINNSLDPDTRYKVGVWNGSDWVELTTVGGSSGRRSDDYGDLSVDFHVPGWDELDNDPVKTNATYHDGDSYTGHPDEDTYDNGTWNITLFNDDFDEQIFDDLNITIKIGNYYLTELLVGDEEIDHLLYEGGYSLKLQVYNWTDGELEVIDEGLDAYILNYTGYDATDGEYFEDPTIDDVYYGYTLGDQDSEGVFGPKGFSPNDVIIPDDDKEKTLWIYVEDDSDRTLNSTIALPVLLNVTLSSLPDVEWGDTFSVSGNVRDGGTEAIYPYDLRIYCPIEGDEGFTNVRQFGPTDFDTDGAYASPEIATGSGEGYGAGTWYLGTYVTGATNRVDMSNEPPYVEGFIPYHSFEVDTKDSATVKVENTDDIVTGFEQTMNISVENESWMEDDNYEFQDMKVHVTGLEGWDGTNEYGSDDIVCVNGFDSFDCTIDDDDDEAYYEFNYTFNETGTATIWVSWPGNLTAIAGTDSLDPVTSSYSDRFNDSTSLIANITGRTTFSVGSPGGFNVFVEDAPEEVKVDDSLCDDGKVNATDQVTTISVFGGSETGEDSYKNATITVQGAGLDFTIEEDDEPEDNDYLNDKDFDDAGNGAWYEVYINPKTAGTLTITVTNDTDTIEKDYAITGLTGSITTSEGDDLEIEVGSTETITLTDVTEFADTWVTFFDEDWECVRLLNESDDAGESSFTPDADDIDEVGFIVVASGVSDRWIYDIIDVVPVEDLTVEVETPEAGNQTLTVGMQQEVVVKVLDSNGDPVTDDEPDLEITLYDVDGDEVDLGDDIDWNEVGDGEWEIDILPYVAGQLKIVGVNATGGIKHNGSTTLDVEHATITYSPIGATAGIGMDNLTVDVTGVDANGNPLSDITLYLWEEDDSGDLDFEDSVDLDEDGIGEFDITEVGDIKTHINATLQDNDPEDGNRTLGKFDIDFPTFTLTPDTVYVGRSNVVEITAEDMNGEALEDVYLTLIKDNVTDIAPEPVLTDENGWVEMSLEPSSSGKFNVTIVKALVWDEGQLSWDGMDYISTDTVVTASHINTMRVSVSKSPIYQGETLTVTVTSSGEGVDGADVEFGGTTAQTDSNGEATFTVPDPGVESATYTVTAEKSGYETADKSITVLKVYSIQLVGPSTPPAPGEEFTVSVIVAGSPLAGATVEFNDNTYTSNANGEITLTAPSSAGSYTVSAAYENYEDGTVTITVEEGGADDVPGFELLTLVAALGVAFILLRRRRRQ